MDDTMLLTTLIDIGLAGFVAVVLWLVIHYRTKAIGDRLDDVERSINELSDGHNNLAREFSELRGEIRGRLGDPDTPLRLLPAEQRPHTHNKPK